MAAKTVLNYLDRDSVVHKMTGTTKLAFFLLFNPGEYKEIVHMFLSKMKKKTA